MSIEVGDTVLVKAQPKFKLDRLFHRPFQVYEVSGTNVKIKPVSNPEVELRTVSLQVSKCKGNFPVNQSWLGHSITRPRKRRAIRKRNPRHPINKQTNSSNQLISPGYKTQHGRTVNPPRRF